MTRIDKNGKCYECKTGRRYAEMSSVIRALAARGQPFSRQDIPQFTTAQSRDRLFQMVRSGELRIVQRGQTGRGGYPPIYQMACHVNNL